MESYTMNGDGDYEIRIRNGNANLPNTSAIDFDDDENRSAHISNLVNFILDITFNLIPYKETCANTVATSTYSFVQNFYSSATAKKITLTNVSELQSSWFSLASDGISCFDKSLSWKRYKLIAQKIFGWTAWISRIGTIGNQAIGITQMIKDDPALTECFTVNGSEVSECKGCVDTFTDPRDGQVYNIVAIGNQCWFAENLNYNSSNSYCYDRDEGNCDTYGKLYNWQTARLACPAGSHLPSSAEYQELIDFLGGEAIAGGKMKATTLWNGPNTGATNESGFSALPAGNWTTYPPPQGSFGNIGALAYWWTSDQTNVVLSADGENVGTASPNTDFRFSCRCLVD